MRLGPYFSQREFTAFICHLTGLIKLAWLALAGGLLTEEESEELRALLEDFFRRRDHRSFRKHSK